MYQPNLKKPLQREANQRDYGFQPNKSKWGPFHVAPVVMPEGKGGRCVQLGLEAGKRFAIPFEVTAKNVNPEYFEFANELEGSTPHLLPGCAIFADDGNGNPIGDPLAVFSGRETTTDQPFGWFILKGHSLSKFISQLDAGTYILHVEELTGTGKGGMLSLWHQGTN